MIALEEAGASYDVRSIDFSKNEQKADWFVQHINPNGRLRYYTRPEAGVLTDTNAGRIPAMVDHSAGDQRVFESASIMLVRAGVQAL